MDRDAIARAARRREAEEALTFEREREEALVGQVEQLVLEEERERIDRGALALLEPGEATLVRELLGEPAVEDEDEHGDEDEWADALAGLDDDPGDEEPDEDEVERLLGEIDASRARQHALERFLDALDESARTEPVADEAV